MDNLNNNQSASLTLAVRNLWAALTKTANKIQELKAENKELELRANEIEKLWVRYNELKERIPELEEKSELADILSKENTELKKENYTLQTSLTELREIEKNFRLSQAEFANKNKLLYENAITIDNLKIKIAELESKQKDYDVQLKTYNDIESDNQKLILELANLNKEIESKTNEILKLSSDLSDANAEIKRLKAVKLSYEETIADLNREFSENEKKLRITEEEKELLSGKLQDFEATKIQIDEVQNKLQGNIDKLRNLEIEFNYLKSDYDEKSRNFEELPEKYKSKENLINELLEENERKDEQIRLFKEAERKAIDLINQKSEWEIEKEKLLDSINSLKQEVNSKDELITKYKELQESFNALTLLKNDLEMQLIKSNRRVEESLLFESKYEELRKEYEELERKKSNLEKELLDINHKMQESLIYKSKYEQILQETKNMIKINDEEKNDLSNKVEKYIDKLEKILD